MLMLSNHSTSFAELGTRCRYITIRTFVKGLKSNQNYIPLVLKPNNKCSKTRYTGKGCWPTLRCPAHFAQKSLIIGAP